MKVLLVTSPHVRHPAVLQNNFKVEQSVMYSFAPVGLLALAASARKDVGTTPSIYDLNRRINDGTIPLGPEFYRNAAAGICALKPDVVGFMTECDSYHHVLQICEAIRTVLPSASVVLGGPHASASANSTMLRYDCIDAVCVGEGEVSFPDYLAAIRDDDSRSVPGVLRRTKNGKLIDGGPRELVKNLDSLPIPAYELYHPDPGEEIFVEVGRGCPFKCTFCSTAPYWQRRHRVKSSTRINEEIRYIVELFGTKRVHFTHDLFTTDKSWVKTVCDALIHAGTPVLWTCSARTDTVDEELMRHMARAGCNAIYFGIESGSERILRDIQKDVSVDHSIDILRTCRRLGIAPNAGFIIGFPTEDENSMAETFVAFGRALETGCRPTHIFGFCPFADSSLFKELEELECTGHFLDLPLGEEIDKTNRNLIGSDPELFGSYFRPKLPWLPAGVISAVDEFSALVDATRLPCLLLAQANGGMPVLYRRWVSWIEATNAARDSAPHRRYYGSPVDFCDFLIKELEGNTAVAAPYALSLARVIRTSLELAARWNEMPPTTMANHRTFPHQVTIEEVGLNTQLTLGDVVDTLEVEYDVSEALAFSSWDEIHDPEAEPLFLVWQRAEEGHLRLVKVDVFLFQAINELKRESRTAAELIVGWANLPDEKRAMAGDLPAVLDNLSVALQTGLVNIKG